jgi:hypothetical protein
MDAGIVIVGDILEIVFHREGDRTAVEFEQIVSDNNTNSEVV